MKLIKVENEKAILELTDDELSLIAFTVDAASHYFDEIKDLMSDFTEADLENLSAVITNIHEKVINNITGENTL